MAVDLTQPITLAAVREFENTGDVLLKITSADPTTVTVRIPGGSTPEVFEGVVAALPDLAVVFNRIKN